MRCELIAVGTELLLGQIVDTNSAWIGERLALAGIDSHFHTTVGDNFDRIADCLERALGRSDAVIMCGGLGPTQDDITRDVIASVMGVALERDPDVAERIRHRFEARGRVMPENNLRQADVPAGARIIEQMPGTAPGLVCPVGERVVYAVPGVPFEMRQMVDGTIVPDLQRRAGMSAVIRSRVLKTWGQSESGLAETLAGRVEALDRIGNPTIAFQASGIEGLKVRITAKAETEDEARRLIAAEETEVRGILGDVVFGIDDETMESVVIEALRRRGLTVAVAEPLTGGLVSSRLVAAEGHAAVLRGAIVPGAADVARQMLAAGLDVDEASAAGLAARVRERFGADIGLAALGVVDESEAHEQPVGTVFMGLAIGEEARSRTVRLPGDRSRLRQFTVITLLNALRLELGRLQASVAP